MRYSNYFGKTIKEKPKGVTIKSHEYLLRGGFINQTAAGIFSFLPFGLAVLKKIDKIIVEEFEKRGIQQILMPFVHPASLWKETGRFEKMDRILAKFKSHAGGHFLLAPTHEETVTDLARKYIFSYKDLPIIVNHNQWKYRDEIRVSGGLLRTREFLMQDAYSFDADDKSAKKSFHLVSEAYHAIFKRMGLKVIVVKADPGAIGGSDSEEFMVEAEAGEDIIFVCTLCDYQANIERAKSRFKTYPQDKKMKPKKDVYGPGLIGVESLSKFLKIPVTQTTKTMIFRADNRFMAVMIRGDYDISETKLINYLNCINLELATSDQIKKLTGAETGYAGPVGLPKEVELVADLTTKNRLNFEAGANKTNYHSINVNFERDFKTPKFIDIRKVKENEGCPKCKDGVLKMKKTIELAHVFKLGTIYSKAMEAFFLDKNGKRKPLVMGCYGIGMTRIIAAAVEQYHDKKGIIWPKNLAPYSAILINIAQSKKQREFAENTYKELLNNKFEVVYDDREGVSAGEKFADWDLIGIPVRLVISDQTKEKIEWKKRSKEKIEMLTVKDIIKQLKKKTIKLNHLRILI